ncbi:hypothetical protein [Winogradskyella sp. 3972H.M.0a.05]|uniref:hypothetical protein n=1 Tax=Winogradskyella sp. 3972H.M.0a.05 TaxID=2950277 RepID=UPI0033980FA6
MKFLTSLFNKQPTAEDVKVLVDNFLKIDKRELYKYQDDIKQLIRTISKVLQTVKKQANGYPNNSINAKVWMDGFGLIENTKSLYEYFRTTAMDSETERFADLWAESTLSVCSHYHHMVGPSMIAAAEMKEKSGDTRTALVYYNAVIKDFQSFTEFNFDEKPPNNDEIAALKSLNIALKNCLKLNNNENLEHLDLLTKTHGILEKFSKANN